MPPVKNRARRTLEAFTAFVVLAVTVGAPAATKHHTAAPTFAPAPPAMEGAFDDKPIHLAPATLAPIAAPKALTRARLASREVFGFAPYWNLDQQQTFQLKHLTTLAYFGVDITRNGTILRSGNGWVGYQSQDLADLITRAHRAGIRVVLTIKQFHEDVIHAIAGAGDTLTREVIAAVKAKNFDGVNIDFEGTGNADRTAFTNLARTLADALHAADPAWQVTLDTYVSSAGDSSSGFMDVAALAPAVDSFFIMGYDMYQRSAASPNAPLPSYQSCIDAYLSQAPAGKIILGMPFYGYDWPTRDNSARSPAAGSPTPVTYEQITAGAHPRYWDATASAPWTAYRSGGQWHEIYYDDPSSLALKARLANAAHLRGTGAWALGMDGSELIEALLGTMTSIVGGPSGPAAPTTTKPTPSSSPTSAPHNAPAPKPTSTQAPKPSSSPTPHPTQTSSPAPLPLPSLL